MEQHSFGVHCLCDDLRFEPLGVPADIVPATYGQDSPDIFLAMLAQRDFGGIRCQQQNWEFFVTARRR